MSLDPQNPVDAKLLADVAAIAKAIPVDLNDDLDAIAKAVPADLIGRLDRLEAALAKLVGGLVVTGTLTVKPPA